MSLRLTLALEAGGLDLPDGPIAVLHPPADEDLSALDAGRVTIVQPFFPDFAAWQARGYHCAPELDGTFAAAIVILPRAKALGRALIAAAAEAAPRVVVDGIKGHGVDSLIKDLRKRVSLSAPLAKAHGKLVWFDGGAFADWRAAFSDIDGFVTAPGVFSADGIDPASALLAQILPDDLGPHVADLGAGWGLLSAVALESARVDQIHLVEADNVALSCARQNIRDPRAVFHWADATQWSPPNQVDTVIMNPPFHTGRSADTSLGQAFITAAARILKSNGTLWMVANRHLPYETALRTAFREGDELAGDARFKLFRAARPARPAQ